MTRNPVHTPRAEFSPLQKVLIVVAVLLGINGIWYFSRTDADTTVGLTLTSNSTLEDGLLGHWTFDNITIQGTTTYSRIGSVHGAAQGFSEVTRYSTAGTHTWMSPPVVTTATVEAWGGGGGGGISVAGGGGGGGGAYAHSLLSITPSTPYMVYVGAGGSSDSDHTTGTSTFGGGLVVACGGQGATSTIGVSGGTTDCSVGTTKYAGGNGGTGTTTNDTSGGGGGAGGPDGAGVAGSDATDTLGGAGGAGDNGSGGAGGTAANGASGGVGGTSMLGGGGGGGGDTTRNGGDGGICGGGGGGSEGDSGDVAGDGAAGCVVITSTRLSTVPGSLGQGIVFDGIDDAISLGDNYDVGSNQSFSISLWFKTSESGENDLGPGLFSKEDRDAATRQGYSLLIKTPDGEATGTVRITTYSNGTQDLASSSVRVDDNIWHHVVAVRDISQGKLLLYLDGILVDTKSGIQTGSLENSYTTYIGRRYSSTDPTSEDFFFNGMIDDSRFYSRTLSGEEVKRLHSLGNTTRIARTVTGGINDNGLTHHWAFDGEGVFLTTVYDRMGANNALHVSTTVPESDYLYSTTTYTSDVSTVWIASSTAVSATVEVWGAGGGGGGGGRQILSGQGGAGGGGGGYAKIIDYDLEGGVGYTVVVGNRGSGGSSGGNGQTGGDTYFNSVSTVFAEGGEGGDGDNGIGGVGGSGLGDVTYTGGNGANDQSSSGGGGGGSAGSESDGNSATTTSGASAVTGGGPGGNGRTSGGNGYAPTSGPGGGGGGGSRDINESDGGNGYDGQMIIVQKRLPDNFADVKPILVMGAIGQGYRFSGVGDYLHIGNAGSGIKTISFWLKTSSSTQYLVDLNGSAYVHLNAGTATTTGFTSPTFYIDGVQSTAFPVDNNWHHVTITTGTDIDASDMDIGRVEGMGFTQGTFDDFRTYSRTLSGEEVKRLHSLGNTTRVATTIPNPALDTGLLGHWTFNGPDVDIAQTTAEVRDRSGNANHGDWQNHATTTIPGVSGQALEFDGLDDYIDFGDVLDVGSGESISFSFWFRTSESGANESWPGLISKLDTDSTPRQGYLISIDSDLSLNKIAFETYSNGTANSVVSSVQVVDSEWHHVVAVRDVFGQKLLLYLDGQLSATDNSINTGSLANSTPLYLGTRPIGGVIYEDNSYKGTLDDIRIYSSALSAEEVKRLYSLGQ